MAHLGHDGFDVHGDDRLILDHKDRPGDGIGHLAPGDGHKLCRLIAADLHHGADLVEAEFLDRMQQKRLARVGGERGHVVLRPARQPRVGFAQGRTGGTPHLMEGAKQRRLGRQPGVERPGIGEDRLKRRGGVGVAGLLAAGQRTGIAAQVRQVGRDIVNFVGGPGIRHLFPSCMQFLWNPTPFGAFGSALGEKFSRTNTMAQR